MATPIILSPSIAGITATPGQHTSSNRRRGECDTQEDIDRYVENDCQFSFDEESETYSAVLHREDGDTLEYSGDEDEFKSILISMEISECREQKTH